MNTSLKVTTKLDLGNHWCMAPESYSDSTLLKPRCQHACLLLVTQRTRENTATYTQVHTSTQVHFTSVLYSTSRKLIMSHRHYAQMWYIVNLLQTWCDLSVCVLVTIESPAKIGEPINMSFEMWTGRVKEPCTTGSCIATWEGALSGDILVDMFTAQECPVWIYSSDLQWCKLTQALL